LCLKKPLQTALYLYKLSATRALQPHTNISDTKFDPGRAPNQKIRNSDLSSPSNPDAFGQLRPVRR